VSTARSDILDVARRRFLTEGYAGVSLRSIATEAGVDAALINYYFGSKRGLFGAALELTINPALVVAEALDAPLEVLPERLLRTLLAVWDDPVYREPLLGMLEGVATDRETARAFREVAEREIFGRIADRLGGRSSSARATGLAVQLAGLIFLRYVVQVEPIASMSADEVVDAVAPGMRTAMERGPRGVSRSVAEKLTAVDEFQP